MAPISSACQASCSADGRGGAATAPSTHARASSREVCVLRPKAVVGLGYGSCLLFAESGVRLEEAPTGDAMCGAQSAVRTMGDPQPDRESYRETGTSWPGWVLLPGPPRRPPPPSDPVRGRTEPPPRTDYLVAFCGRQKKQTCAKTINHLIT
jgi:hypothetical protein